MQRINNLKQTLDFKTKHADLNIIIRIDKAYHTLKDKYLNKKNTPENRHFLKYDLMYEIGYDCTVDCDEKLNTKDVIKHHCFVAKINYKDGYYKERYLIFGDDMEYVSEMDIRLNKNLKS